MPIELVRIYRTRGVREDTRGRNSRVASKDKLPLKRLDNRDLYLRLVAHAMIGAARQDSLDLLERKRPEWTALTSGVGHFSVQMVTLGSAQDDCTTPFAIPLVLDGSSSVVFSIGYLPAPELHRGSCRPAYRTGRRCGIRSQEQEIRRLKAKGL